MLEASTEGDFVDDAQRKPDPHPHPLPPDDDDATRLLPAGDGGPARTRAMTPGRVHDPANAAARAGAARAPAHALAPGTRLHEFEISEVLGEGGFGIVYLARDHSLGRVVAVKEYMPSSLADRSGGLTVSLRSGRHAETFQAGLRSFVNEARLLAHFDHPSLLKVHRFWEAHGTAYMAMPYYHGQTLKARLQQAASPPTEAWLRSLLVPLLDALKAMHAEHCFHRDIAPDNILLLADERPVLLDFGAARQVIGDMTQGLTVILKSGYAPIEQYAEINTLRQGPWTDLYALGATLHMALTGKPPAPAVQRMLGDAVEPLVERLRGKYGERFLAAIDATLQVNAADRPQDVAALEALLGVGEAPGLLDAAAVPSGAPEATALRQPAAEAEAQADADPESTVLFKAEQAPFRWEPPAATQRSRRKTALAALGAAAAIAGAAWWGVSLLGRGGSPALRAELAQAAASTPSAALADEPQPKLRVAAQAAASTPSAEADLASHSTPPWSAAVNATAPAPVVAPAPRASPPPAAVAQAPRLTVPKAAKPPVPSGHEATTTPAPPVNAAPVLAPAKPEDKPTAMEVSSASQVDKLVARARRQLSQHDYPQAAALARRALAIEPGHARAAEILRLAREGQDKAFDDIKIQ